jgi:hypothetical protein
LIDRRRHSSILDVQYFRRADFDTDYYMVLAGVRERLAVRKRATPKMDRDRFNLKLNKREDKEQYQFTTTKKFPALENL